MRIRFAAPLALLVAACQPAPPAVLSDADKAAIQKATDSTVALMNAATPDPKAYASVYFADNAMVMPANAPAMEGRDAIVAMFAGSPPITNVKFTVLNIDGTPDMAAVTGSYEMDIAIPGAPAPMHDKGKYLDIWKKQADGSWKAVKSIYNSDLPMPGSEAPPPAKN
ncbi:MAG: DUF4440 domain-containing protein [Gemmatimonadales bacterium]|nr:DUF4440 domain-containing protein [Gemmatimonadales bacterium]